MIPHSLAIMMVFEFPPDCPSGATWALSLYKEQTPASSSNDCSLLPVTDQLQRQKEPSEYRFKETILHKSSKEFKEMDKTIRSVTKHNSTSHLKRRWHFPEWPVICWYCCPLWAGHQWPLWHRPSRFQPGPPGESYWSFHLASRHQT